MGWFKTFMEKYVTTHDTGGVSIDADTVIIDISAETYLKELAVYTAVSPYIQRDIKVRDKVFRGRQASEEPGLLSAECVSEQERDEFIVLAQGHKYDGQGR